MKLTATLIARDEGHRLARCLDSLHFVDEIVIAVDQRTVDDTREVASRYTSNVFDRTFDTYAGQRQAALERATGDWILWMDCDEVVPSELATEIAQAAQDSRFAAFRVPRLDFMFGKWIRHGGWYPQYHVRLFRRGHVRWERAVHEVARVDGTVGRLKSPMHHFSHIEVGNWIAKMHHYTELEAREMFAAGQRLGLLRSVMESPLYWAYKFLIQQGWRDGTHGVVLAGLLGCYRLLRNVRLWELNRVAGRLR